MKQIAFFGSIGVGKTTAGNLLADKYKNVQFLIEDLSENPFLPNFYADMHRWGFHSSIAMLALMSSYYRRIDHSKEIVILDNGVQELIAYTMLECDMQILSDSEYFVYKKLYDNIVELLPEIDLFVYFICDEEEALKRIRKRGRSFELDLTLEFLQNLNKKYRDFVATLPEEKVMIVDTTHNYNLEQLVQDISNKLGCQFK